MSDTGLTRLRSILTDLAPQSLTALLPALHAALRFHGWLSEPVVTAVIRSLGVPLADVYGHDIGPAMEKVV